MTTDLWSYAGDIDESRMRMAALAVQLAAPDGSEVRIAEDGHVEVEVPGPWWSGLTLGLWRRVKQKKVERRCRQAVPRIVGWCPQVEVTKCPR